MTGSDYTSCFFDPKAEFRHTTGGNLPHRHQCGKIQYVTFRLGDSLPAHLIKETRNEILSFMRNYPEPWDEATKRLYRREISKRKEQLADNGYGSCIFRNPDIRSVLTDLIEQYEGVYYNVIAYVIMPNHVHMLLTPIGEHDIKQILKIIKGSSAKIINEKTKNRGSIWMRESYDHLVRNEDELKHCYHYIRRNPEGLSPAEYTLYI